MSYKDARLLICALLLAIMTGVSGLCADTASVEQQVRSDFENIMSGKAVLSMQNGNACNSATLTVLQMMLAELDSSLGGPSANANQYVPGVYNKQMKDAVAAFQVNAMGISPTKDYVGTLGSMTLQEILTQLRFQNKHDAVDYYLSRLPATSTASADDASRPSTVPDQALPASVPSESPDNDSTAQRELVTKHTVAAGESIFSIADRYAVPRDKIIKDNALSTPEKIYPGQVLLIRKTLDIKPESIQPEVSSPQPAVSSQLSVAGKQPFVRSGEASVRPAAFSDKYRSAILNEYDNKSVDSKYDQMLEARKQSQFLENLTVTSKQNKEILLALGETQIYKSASDVRKIAIGNPAVADTLLLDARQILINAKNVGTTTMTVWNDQGRQDVYYLIVSKKSAVIQTTVFKLKYLKLKTKELGGGVVVRSTIYDAINSVLRGILDEKNYSIFVDLNTIVAQGTTDELRRIQDFLDKVDKPIEQILITAKVAEVDKDSSSTLKFTNEGTGGSFSGKFSENDGGILSYTLGGVYNTLFTQQLQALVSEGKAKLLATPKVLVQSGEISKVDVVDSIPFIQKDANESKIIYIDAGVLLSVFPQANFNGTISTYVQAEVSNLTAELYQGYPSIQKRQASTMMTVKDGETIVLAGLVKEDKTESVSKVPILGDIPFLGALFTSNTQKSKEVELIIALTQQIIN